MYINKSSYTMLNKGYKMSLGKNIDEQSNTTPRE